MTSHDTALDRRQFLSGLALGSGAAALGVLHSSAVQAQAIAATGLAPLRDVAGKVTRTQLREIAEKKMKDLNANDIESAAKIIEGSARAMGLQVVEA